MLSLLLGRGGRERRKKEKGRRKRREGQNKKVKVICSISLPGDETKKPHPLGLFKALNGSRRFFCAGF